MENETFTFAFYIPTRYHRVTENGVARSSHPLSIIAWTTQTKQKNAVKKKKKKKKKKKTHAECKGNFEPLLIRFSIR